MPNYILKFDTEAGPRYMDWSTIVDAPITCGLTLDEFKSYYKEQFGARGMQDLPQRLERVEKKGTSSHIHKNRDDVLSYNRAGKNNTCLTVEQIVDFYVVHMGEGEQPKGTKP